MSQRENEMNGRGCLGVMAALLAVPAVALGLGVAAVSLSGCANAQTFEDAVKAQPAQCQTQANLDNEDIICQGANSVSTTGNIEVTIDETKALAADYATNGCSNQCSTDVGWITFGKIGGVAYARQGMLAN